MSFINDDFMLSTKTARELYHESAEKMPIIDYHCHLVPQMIAENYQFKDLTEVWLGGDHYKWRAMRGNGVPEEYITGNRSSYEKFEKWAETMPYTMRNPLYHWTHLELARVFGVDKINTNPHGFDGLFLDSIPFEHKNNTYGTKNYLDADYIDLSIRRVNKFGQGSLNVVTAFDGVGAPMYSVVYDSTPIYGILLDAQKNYRQRATVSFNDLIKAGAKVVTYEKSRKEAFQDIMSEYPNSGLKLSDIYTEKDAMMLAKKAVGVM